MGWFMRESFSKEITAEQNTVEKNHPLGDMEHSKQREEHVCAKALRLQEGAWYT